MRGRSSAAEKLFVSSHEFFQTRVQEAFEHTKMETNPDAQAYLVSLLEFYLDARNLYALEDSEGKRRPETLAELYLRGVNASGGTRIELLKRLGDTSLYISGFFGDSLQQKLIDIDYYVEMGETAYSTLARCVRAKNQIQIFRNFARQFTKFMDVLSYISQESMVQNNESLLRLYDKYMQTGSELAREKLTEMGLVTPLRDKKGNRH